MKNCITLTFALSTVSLPASYAFHVLTPKRSQVRLLATKNSESSQPFDATTGIDIERAKDCAEHFGKCSTKEMEDLRNSLHQERLQTMIVGEAVIPPEEAFQHLLLEEELNLQLSLLNDATPPLMLFPNDETEKHVAIEPTVGEKILMVEEAIVEENLGDAIAICLVLAAIFAAPHLLHL